MGLIFSACPLLIGLPIMAAALLWTFAFFLFAMGKLSH
jgi:hypothetical protein